MNVYTNQNSPGMASSPPSDAPISNACRRLEGAIERLCQSVATLTLRLSPVLGPSMPNPPMAPGCIAAPRPDTPLSETIKQRANAIDNATNELADILVRLGLE